jgi:hypothetical protein
VLSWLMVLAAALPLDDGPIGWHDYRVAHFGSCLFWWLSVAVRTRDESSCLSTTGSVIGLDPQFRSSGRRRRQVSRSTDSCCTQVHSFVFNALIYIYVLQ